MQLIKGRDTSLPIYQVRAPESWIRRDPLPDESLEDTTKALVEFIIADPEGLVRIWIYNFPSSSLEERFPPIAQVERWQRQFELLHPQETEAVSLGYNGYIGVLFSGTGVLRGTDKTVMAWALQVAGQHYETLCRFKNVEEAERFKQMRADVTIKAEGAPLLMERHFEKICAFAQSFELIDEIPDPW